jgi:hypothetical protein
MANTPSSSMGPTETASRPSVDPSPEGRSGLPAEVGRDSLGEHLRERASVLGLATDGRRSPTAGDGARLAGAMG